MLYHGRNQRLIGSYNRRIERLRELKANRSTTKHATQQLVKCRIQLRSVTFLLRNKASDNGRPSEAQIPYEDAMCQLCGRAEERCCNQIELRASRQTIEM